MFCVECHLPLGPGDHEVCSNCAEEIVDELEELGPDEAVCRVCGCSQDDACPGGCIWATPDLCSRCV